MMKRNERQARQPRKWSSSDSEDEESSSREGEEEEESTWRTEEEQLISSFLEVAVGQSPQTAAQLLRAADWKLDRALQLFYEGSGGGGGDDHLHASSSSSSAVVRPPLPIVRQTLYDDAMLYAEEPPSTFEREQFWEGDEGLDSLYRPPYHLMFEGSFEEAKALASMDDKWLLVNMQSTEEFSSHVLNRDTWSNKQLAEAINTSFVFWQSYNDHPTDEGSRVCAFYKVDSVPAVLIIDPITGQKMRPWFGVVKPESLLEDLFEFITDREGGPKGYHPKGNGKKRGSGGASGSPVKRDRRQVVEVEEEEMLVRAIEAASMNAAAEEEPSEKPTFTYPPLPEEPKGSDRSLLCRVGVRLPDGRRVQRSFLRSDPIQLLWSFCHSQLGEAAHQSNTTTFRLILPIPGASQSLDYDSKLRFEESGLANSMITVALMD